MMRLPHPLPKTLSSTRQKFVIFSLLTIAIVWILFYDASYSSVNDHTKQIEFNKPTGIKMVPNADVGNDQSGYKRYSAYHPYCSDPNEMKTRSIPSLSKNSTTSQILHATVVIRHGARTPSHGDHFCWDGYWDAPQGVWDCTNRQAQLFATSELEDYTNRSEMEDVTLTIEKVYDVFSQNSNLLKNELNGTCQEGQLLWQGRQQQITNGRILRDAYVFDSNKQQHQDPRLSLFDTSRKDGDTSLSLSQIRFRSDDDQRTVASGQALLSSMFGPELKNFHKVFKRKPVITLHIADRLQDILTSLPSCEPILTAKKKARRSDEFKLYSKTTELFEKLMINEWGGLPKNPVDCLMTAMCTDRPIPPVVNDYNVQRDDEDDQYTETYGSNRFQRLVVNVSAPGWYQLGSLL